LQPTLLESWLRKTIHAESDSLLSRDEQRVAFGLSSEVDTQWTITIAPVDYRGRIAANFF
jgi:hypothetical protein